MQLLPVREVWRTLSSALNRHSNSGGVVFELPEFGSLDIGAFKSGIEALLEAEVTMCVLEAFLGHCDATQFKLHEWLPRLEAFGVMQ